MVADPHELEKKIGYRFGDGRLLADALTHASSVGEREGHSNERLEFVGDAVIDLTVAQMLYTHHPSKDEGWLSQMRSRLVDEESLAAKARSIDLGKYIILGKGEEAAGGREKPSILAGAYEALIGALLIDGGYEFCSEIIERYFPEIAVLADDADPKNFKSLLQERLQKDGKGLPQYSVIDVSGPDHERVFSVAVFIDGVEWGRGSGRSKKDAEQDAAQQALRR
jgi:ribonuclease-3